MDCCLQGDLTAGEIVEQLVHARALSPIRNVVFMGMGVSVSHINLLLQSRSDAVCFSSAA